MGNLEIYIYNTLDKEKEILKPIEEKKCSMYSCVPTVYDYAHIGNFRYFLFVDLLRRTLKYSGYELNHVMNITDVGHLVSDADEGEDKMMKASKREQKSPWEIARFYEKVFIGDMEKLNIDKPEKIIRVTDHIKDMEEYVKKIIENGYTYQTEDTVYFDTSKLDKYGVLSKINTEMQKAGARVEFDSGKRNLTDFALWIKAPKEHIMRWDSFFGESYPGWHLECSALSNIYLGKKFDIHTGGEDHIHIHHENEIAQSKGHSGCIPANYWMHSGFLQIDGGKMSKSLGNTYTISTLEEKGYDALDFKMFTFTAHYRTKLNFTFKGLDSAKESLRKLRKIYFKNKNSENGKEFFEIEENKYLLNEIEEIKNKFISSMQNDLNIPSAMAEVWKMVKLTENRYIAEIIKDFDRILGLDIDNIDRLNKILKEEEQIKNSKEVEVEKLDDKEKSTIKAMLEERKIARENKDFQTSDKIRDELLNMGYIVIDLKGEQKLERK